MDIFTKISHQTGYTRDKLLSDEWPCSSLSYWKIKSSLPISSRKLVCIMLRHTCKMVSIFKVQPQELIDWEERWRDIPWERSFPGPRRIRCATTRKYYDEPLFDSKGMSKVQTSAHRTIALTTIVGHITYPQMISADIKLDDFATGIAHLHSRRRKKKTRFPSISSAIGIHVSPLRLLDCEVKFWDSVSQPLPYLWNV